MSISLVAPTRAATRASTSPSMRRTGASVSADTSSKYSGSIPWEARAASAVALTAAASRSPAATDSFAAASTRCSAVARERSASDSRTLRLDMASPSGSRTVGQDSI